MLKDQPKWLRLLLFIGILYYGGMLYSCAVDSAHDPARYSRSAREKARLEQHAQELSGQILQSQHGSDPAGSSSETSSGTTYSSGSYSGNSYSSGSYSSGSSYRSRDPYGASGYDSEEDFWEDWSDDFEDEEDALDYWESHQ